MRMAAIYARVSSEQQREENTIASQTASLIEFAKGHNLEVPEEWVFEDEGYSGAILERSRRGKRHRAHSGEISVMSGAPYGYRYIRKTDEAPAAYIVHEPEAGVVRRVYEMYTVQGLSIGEITRRINAEGIPTRKVSARWERSTVWAVLRNSAYRGAACFGKTRISARTRVMRPQRRRGVTTPSTTTGHERPREEWIAISVPALVTEESFARAQELLYQNKIRSRRRTIVPSVVQGLVSCAKCGYAFSRTSTQTSARKIHYYKCIGSDGWRKLGGPVCDNGRFVRQELLDQIVWAEVIRLLEEPALIQQELDRRLAAARSSDPTRKREQSLQRELTHVGKGIERLLNAYQEGLLSIEQLRERMPGLRQRQQALCAELQAIADQTNDGAAFLRLAETLTAFLARLRSASETLSVTERQRIVRLLVKDVLVGEDTITIRHSIPIPSAPPQNGGSQSPEGPNYLLCTGRGNASLWGSVRRFVKDVLFHVTRFQPLSKNDSVHGNMSQKPFMTDFVETAFNVAFENQLRLCVPQCFEALFDRVGAGPLLTEPIRVPVSSGFHHRIQCKQMYRLLRTVDHGRDSERPHLLAIRFRDVDTPKRLRLIAPTL